MMSIVKNHPRKALAILSITLFFCGFYREKIVESMRIRTLVESTVRADRYVQELVFAYDLRMNTVRALVVHARKNGLEVSADMMQVFDEVTKPDVSDMDDLRVYLRRQMDLSSLAVSLITQMDMDLAPADKDFPRLFREFQKEEESLNRLRESYRQQTQRVRAIARKGDRQFINPGLHFPAEGRL
ncbi:MAG: hypothetical protein KF799_14245 [Bdellovibrionales bacterium]|nr:hypothetical protein [Bdellovibrionales bacterium]